MDNGITMVIAAVIATFASIFEAFLFNRPKNASTDLEWRMKVRQARMAKRF